MAEQAPAPAPNPWEEVRLRAGGPGGSVHLATVGAWLVERGIRSKDLPGGLGGWLRQWPAYASVVGDATREKVEFHGGSPPSWPDPVPPPADDLQGVVLPVTGLTPMFWRAMVANQEGHAWYLDLASYAIELVALVDGTPGDPVASVPHRWLRVPTINTADQQEQGRRALAPKIGQDHAEKLTERANWLEAAHSELPGHLLAQVLTARKAWVVERGLAFLRAHNLPVTRFTYTRTTASSQGPTGEKPISSLRRAVHTAIDRMTDAELSSLPIPARLLLP